MLRLLSIVTVIALVGISTWLSPARAQFGSGEMMVEASLVSERTSIAPGETFYIGLKQDIAEGWHTYWRNPGDSGEPTRLVLDLPEGWQVGELIWPAPNAYPLGPLTNYGYSNEIVLPIALTAPVDMSAGSITITGHTTLSGQATWLVCEDICIPEEADVSLSLNVGSSQVDVSGAAAIEAALSGAPIALGDEAGAGVEKSETGLTFTFSGEVFESIHDRLEVYPYETGIIDHAAEQVVAMDGDAVRVDVKNGYLTRRGIDTPVSLLVSFYDAAGTRQAYELVAQPDMAVNTLVAGSQSAIEDGVEAEAGAGSSQTGSLASSVGGSEPVGISFAQAALFALIGGLILNLMPCVFPVLSMKALTLVEKRGADRSEARLLGIIFAIGVIGTFLVLGAGLLALRVAGLPGIWGMQLQVPVVVVSLALLMFLIGLNFLGVFELGTSLQNVGSGVRDTGRRGAFLTGVLAVFVAAPCLAPFMTGALAFALAQPPLASLTVFAFLGLGLALPFVIVSFVPGLLGFLPKPGAWMVRFRQLLAFPMFATAIWLVWVLVSQVGSDGVIWGLLAFLAAGFTVWAFSMRGGLARLTAMLGVVLTLGAVLATARLEAVEIGTPSGGDWTSWDPVSIEQAQAEGRPVFVDFTAAWCVTCQVNKLGPLSDSAVKAAFVEADMALFRADFTNQDPVIAAELARHNAPGVPLYLVYPADAGEPEVLPPLLTPSIVIQSVERAVN